MIDKQILKRLVEEFSKPREEFGGKSYITRRREWFDKPMENVKPLIKTPEAIDKLTIENAEKIYREATVGGPRLYPKTFRENGIEKIRKSFKYFLFGKDPIEVRFYNFAENPESEYRLNGVGRAFASTLLFLIDHKNNGIWNSAIDGGLEILGLLPPKRRNENMGQRYVKIVRVLKDLAQQCGFDDLSIVDEFVELIFHKTIGERIIQEKPEKVTAPPEEIEVITPGEKETHLQMEYMLIKIGKWKGYEVWVAVNDFNKKYDGEKFSSLCLPELPHFASSSIMEIAKLIDVIWFKKGTARPIRFFEVEHTGSIYSGLLRMNDIIIDYPIQKATIVGPENKQKLFEKQIKRRTFIDSGLSEVCDFMDYDKLKKWFRSEKELSMIER